VRDRFYQALNQHKLPTEESQISGFGKQPAPQVTSILASLPDSLYERDKRAKEIQ
jgi:hypothetical protein